MMKKIGLILEGKTAQIFLEKLLTQYHSSNFYTIITQDQDLIPLNYPDHFTFFHFDPSSTSKLRQAFASDLDFIFLIHQSAQESLIIYEILKDLFPKTPVICPSQEHIVSKNNLLEEILIPLVISNKLLTYLPNIPAPVQDIGLGKGEIMEVPIPPGSVYCYRTLGSIAQKDWRIAGIYRNEELLLSSYSLSIQPNDKLLIIGNPKILSNVYRQIKSSLGQFPIPFGKDLFLYLDEDLLSENEMMCDLEEALFLHKYFKNSHQLNIVLLNPKRFEFIQHIKSLQDENINVYIDYNALPLQQILKNHHQKKIGLAILHHKLFHLQEIKQTLFELLIPTFKTGKRSIQECQSSLIFIENDQSIAPTILDIASQLKLELEIYDFDVDGKFHSQALEIYKNLSQIFTIPIHLTKSDMQNPIIYLLELQKPLLQFLPFDPSIINNALLGATSTHTSYHSTHLNKNPQILIPNSYENN